MKFKLISFAVLCLALATIAQDANQMHYINVFPPSSATNATVTGTGVDVSGYKGNGTFVIQTGTSSATNNAITVTIQTSAVIGSGYYTLTNVAAVAGVVTEAGVSATSDTVNIQKFACSLAKCAKYVRAIYTQTPADNYVPVSVVLVAPMK